MIVSLSPKNCHLVESLEISFLRLKHALLQCEKLSLRLSILYVCEMYSPHQHRLKRGVYSQLPGTVYFYLTNQGTVKEFGRGLRCSICADTRSHITHLCGLFNTAGLYNIVDTFRNIIMFYLIWSYILNNEILE